MNHDTAAPRTVDRATFQGEVDALRIREKAHTRDGDAIAAARRRLPMVAVNAAASLIGEHGQELWEDSPTGWPQRGEGSQRMRTGNRPTSQWSRLKAGRSDSLRAGGA
ncbi:MAG TPA: DUF899 family protein [Nitrospiraceae bacterium]|nr:DUF899 family protein [Nitrospiraceae bacterium]